MEWILREGWERESRLRGGWIFCQSETSLRCADETKRRQHRPAFLAQRKAGTFLPSSFFFLNLRCQFSCAATARTYTLFPKLSSQNAWRKPPRELLLSSCFASTTWFSFFFSNEASFTFCLPEVHDFEVVAYYIRLHSSCKEPVCVVAFAFRIITYGTKTGCSLPRKTKK